ncbi:MAG: signal recognition particle protein, partial [Thermoflexales bacterium]|nr:signal recognition particle protein [Thermoflexales bacterium]
AEFDEKEATKTAERMLSSRFDLEDFLGQIQQIKKMGPLGDLLKMIPGYNQISKDVSPEMTEGQMKRTEAIIYSMTRKERRDPNLLNASRKRRVARGSGTEVQHVNELLRQFKQAQTMMKQIQGNPRLRNMMRKP